MTIRTGIGAVHDDAATKNAEAQRFYDQGLAYLHNYVWIEAARSFHQALRLDPQLALAHVGLSYAYIELNKTAQARQAIDDRADARREVLAITSSVTSTRARCRWRRRMRPAIRRSSPPIASRSTPRSPRFQTTWNSCCAAASLNLRIRPIVVRDRSWDRLRITSGC